MTKAYRLLGIVLLVALSLSACVVVAPVAEDTATRDVARLPYEALVQQSMMKAAWAGVSLDVFAETRLTVNDKFVDELTAADYAALVRQHYRTVAAAAWERANLAAFAETRLTIDGKTLDELTHADHHRLAGM